MKKYAIFLVLLLMTALTHPLASAQDKLSLQYFGKIRVESQLSYNFLTGEDATDFSTSIKGFGSGLLDLFGTRTSVDILSFGTDKFFISAGAGFAVMKYRLSKNLVFGNSADGNLTWSHDTDTSHNYVNTFFGFGKSKIITTSIYFPVDLNLAFGKNLILSAGGYVDLNLTARYKMKYLSGQDQVKEIIRSSEFRKFNPSTTKFGVNISVFLKKPDIGISASYSITPFFKSGMGADIHEAHISAGFSIHNLREPGR